MKKIYTILVLTFLSVIMQAQCLVTITSSNIQCNGECNGSATANPVGVPPYNFLWSPGGMTTQTITGLCAGTYTVTVVDGASCTSTSTATIVEPTAMTATSTQTNPSCNGDCNGTATAFVSGGTPGYTHKWNTVPAQTSATANGLCAGVYYDTISDANGCTTILPPVTITQPGVLVAGATASSVTCFGGNNGSATASATGGTPAYSFSWSTIPAQTTATITGLSAGTYTCTVTDSKGCTSTASCVVNQPSSSVAVVGSSTSASCPTCCDGSASSSVAGGTPGYTYLWSPGGETTSGISAICPGNYTVCATDANGCSHCDTVSVNFSVGINEVGTDDWNIYPNPVSSVLEIEISKVFSGSLYLRLYDLLGNRVLSTREDVNGVIKKNLALQFLPPGAYFLELELDGKSTTKKIIKQ